MGLALLIVALKTIALRNKDERYNEAARFWARIFAVNFLIGVVTGIPMEFQFGTNWSQFARTTGGVIGQPLAMEGLFSTQRGAGIVLIGQPNEENQTIDNPLAVNKVLSFLIYGTTESEVKGLDQIPRDQWPEPLPLLFYAYHIMAGLGTYFLLLMAVAALLLWRGQLFSTP